MAAMPNVGPMELLLLGLVGLLLFGPKRLPEIGRSIGSAMREFKESVNGLHETREPDTSSPAPVSSGSAVADQPPET